MNARSTLRLTAILLLLGTGAAQGGPARGSADVAALLEGVERVALPGVPGTISVFGPQAFAVLCAPAGGRPAPIVAATRLGKGRVVMFAHNGYFGDAFGTGDTGRLLVNACRWAAGTKSRSRAPRVGVLRHVGLVPRLRAAGLEARTLTSAAWLEALRELDVLCGPIADLDPHETQALRRWLRAGGGLLCGLPGWGWQQLNPGKDLASENAGNRLLAPAGLVWGDGSIQKPPGGVLPVEAVPPALTHAGLALEALMEQEGGRRALSASDAALAVATVSRCIRDVPAEDKLLLPRLGRLIKRSNDPSRVPRAERPLQDEDGLGKLLLTLQIERDRDLPPEKIRAHPAAAAFPGVVPGRARRVTRRVTIDTGVPGWHGTGLYAAPGEVVTARMPDIPLPKGFRLRIGAHTDRLWNKAAWKRAPEITRSVALGPGKTRAACAFGGLLYVVVPSGVAAGAIEVEIGPAVEAPLFVLGETDPDAWRARIRKRPAPWAELTTSKVAITVPSAVVRELDDPAALMAWWDRVMDACADLAALPTARARPERYVTDVQISAGYMHAGYPIMTHLDAAERFVDLERLSTQGDWGMFHEMGHNHQHRDWTFGGTTEVTCNLFSLYCMETVCEKGRGHEAMSPESIARNRALYRKGGATFGLWKTKPFTALILYYELREAFGWEAYKRVFAEYRDLLPAQRPRTDAQKRDQWLVRMSRTIGRDLGPFFESWGVPTSAKARATLTDLPAWMPAPKDG